MKLYTVRSRSIQRRQLNAIRYAILRIASGVTLLISAANRWGEKRRQYFPYVLFAFPRSRERPHRDVIEKISLYIIVEAFQFNRNGDDTRYHRRNFSFHAPNDRTHLPTLSLMKKISIFSERGEKK